MKSKYIILLCTTHTSGHGVFLPNFWQGYFNYCLKISIPSRIKWHWLNSAYAYINVEIESTYTHTHIHFSPFEVWDWNQLEIIYYIYLCDWPYLWIIKSFIHFRNKFHIEKIFSISTLSCFPYLLWTKSTWVLTQTSEAKKTQSSLLYYNLPYLKAQSRHPHACYFQRRIATR